MSYRLSCQASGRAPESIVLNSPGDLNCLACFFLFFFCSDRFLSLLLARVVVVRGAAVGGMVKSILSDTSLVIAGTTLSLALCLGMEAGPSADQVLGGVSGVLGGVWVSGNGEGPHAEL